MVDEQKITHKDLCKLTAERFIKDLGDVVLYEYQSHASWEHPDVLLYGYDRTILFEIKMSKQDFKNEAKKECRIMERKNIHTETGFEERPHLGLYRYYVCPHGLINETELPDRWGLYWYKNGRFYCKNKSKKFKRNIQNEINLLTHAIRKVNQHNETNVITKPFLQKY